MSDKSESKYLVLPLEVVMEQIETWAKRNSVEFHWYDEYAKRVGIDKETMDHLCSGNQPITPEIAVKLEPLGEPAKYWLELERKYQEDREALSGISRWRKVSDESPPKDGKDFNLRRDGYSGTEKAHFVFRWFEEAESYQDTVSGLLYGELFLKCKNQNWEWAPIPD